MSRYRQEELKSFALTFLYYDGAGDPRADVVLSSLSQIFRTSVTEIRRQIRLLADK